MVKHNTRNGISGSGGVPSPADAGPYICVVDTPLREGPEMESKKLATLRAGTEVEVATTQILADGTVRCCDAATSGWVSLRSQKRGIVILEPKPPDDSMSIRHLSPEEFEAHFQVQSKKQQAAISIQKIWRSYFLRVRIGIIPSRTIHDPVAVADLAMQNTPLNKTEKSKLVVFVCLNLVCGLATGFVAAYIFVQKILPSNEHEKITGQSTRALFMLNLAIMATSAFGIMAASKKYVTWLRAYAFLLMLLVCLEISLLLALILNHDMNEGSAQVQERTIQNIKLHLCEAVEYAQEHVDYVVNETEVFDGSNGGDAQSITDAKFNRISV
eukprot:SAG11_NODE_7254_length_1172_cov_1.164958_1_plen_328_part_00